MRVSKPASVTGLISRAFRSQAASPEDLDSKTPITRASGFGSKAPCSFTRYHRFSGRSGSHNRTAQKNGVFPHEILYARQCRKTLDPSRGGLGAGSRISYPFLSAVSNGVSSLRTSPRTGDRPNTPPGRHGVPCGLSWAGELCEPSGLLWPAHPARRTADRPRPPRASQRKTVELPSPVEHGGGLERLASTEGGREGDGRVGRESRRAATPVHRFTSRHGSVPFFLV